MKRSLPLLCVVLVLLSQVTIDTSTAATTSVSARRVAALERRQKRREARLKQWGISSSSASSPSSLRSSVSSSSSSSRSQSSVSPSSRARDPLADTSPRSQIVLLGQTTPMLAAFDVLIDQEPLDVSTITVYFTADVSRTVHGLLLYHDDRRLLARATLDGSAGTGRKFVASIPLGTLVVPRREVRTVYARAELMDKDGGALSGDTLEVEEIEVKGNGVWSSTTYQKNSTKTFLAFQTARSKIASAVRSGDVSGLLVSGTQRQLGAFTLEGKVSDPSAKVQIQSLSLTIEQAGGITLSSVGLLADGETTKHSCSVASTTTVTCSSIPASYGALEGGPRTLTLYGDITVPSGLVSASLRLTLNEAGTISTAGSITWTDGTTTFTWVDLESPVVSGTLYKF